MSKIKLGCHVGMAGKEMFLASAKPLHMELMYLCYTQVHHRTPDVKIYQSLT